MKQRKRIKYLADRLKKRILPGLTGEYPPSEISSYQGTTGERTGKEGEIRNFSLHPLQGTDLRILPLEQSMIMCGDISRTAPASELCYSLLGYMLLLLFDAQLTLRVYFLHTAGFTSAPTTARSQLTSLGNQTNRTGSKMGQRPAQGSRPTSAGPANCKELWGEQRIRRQK